jgi:Zn-dependent protease with chaperone function
LLLIALGVIIVIGSFWGSYHLIIDVLPEVGSGRAIILIIMSVIGLCLLAIMLGIYLIKPLFAFKKNHNETRVEVFETECPDLFAMIRDVAGKTGCKMPKHVYLSPDVNACVFYDTSFWSIFFPIKKNLEIGLGLFDGTSVEEVKSIIAHEFGHFSQNSMKVGSTVYVTNTVLHDLIYAEDFWDRFVDKWCLSDTGVIRFFGVLTRGLTNIINRLTFYVYKFVQKGYLKLSRYMEYDADNIACQCVGSDNFVSAMCKIDSLSNKDGLYKHLLSNLIDEKKIVANYFIGKRIVANIIPNKDMPVLQYDEQLIKPIRTFEIESRVKVEDVWSSHPSLEDRLDNARAQHCPATVSRNPIPAWSLIPDVILERVSTNYTSFIRKNVDGEISYISDEQLKEWMQKEVSENFMDDRLRPFFGKNIIQFDVDKEVEMPTESPLTESNARKIAEFSALLNDWSILNQVNLGQIEAREVLVDGKVYSKKKLPIESFRIELDILHEQVVNIYNDIYAYIGSKCEEEQKAHFRLGFVAVFYARHIRNELLPSLFEHRDNLYNELSRVTRRDEDEYSQLCSYVRDYEAHLKKVVSELDLDWMAHTFISEEYINNLKEYTKEEHNSRVSINTDAINTMFQITDSLDNVANTIEGAARRLICDITKKIIDN